MDSIAAAAIYIPYQQWARFLLETKTLYDLIYTLKPQTTTSNKKHKPKHRYREQTGGCREGGGWEDGQNRWRVLRGTNFQL